jgi:adenosylcobinamide-GDP ribazoletransferase
VPGLVTAAAAAAGFAGVIGLAVRRLGGYTGDVLGAAGVIAETVGLLVAAARW